MAAALTVTAAIRLPIGVNALQLDNSATCDLLCPRRCCSGATSSPFVFHGVLMVSFWRAGVATGGAPRIACEKVDSSGLAEGRQSISPFPRIRGQATDWKRAKELKQSGDVVGSPVEASNSGGLILRFGSLQAFLPYSQVDPARIKQGPEWKKSATEIGKELIGSMVTAKIIEVNEDEGRLVLSEKQAVLQQRLEQVEEGKVFTGRVNSLIDFGAFVDLKFPDGSYPVNGLVHVSELSWDVVRNVADVVIVGQEVEVMVINIDRQRQRIGLSIKQLQADPLLDTLDTLLPAVPVTPSTSSSLQQEESEAAATPDSKLNPAEDVDSDATEDQLLLKQPLPGLPDICAELLKEEGIENVSLGRQAMEKRKVSQDLELWLSSAQVERGVFTLLARAGRQVQEVYVSTALDREGLKSAVQRVTGRVP
eukprot:TRINITY_DN7017_c0_g1_i1.p1 TRINITY_DN7017_c0_g1~~TRINITY_DN7017_c0_g1_i1.p1  ORF type:complete len:442 (-),score=118.58 TRINITY_DN7017_c0_g1_i1:188-1456(-)